MKGIPTEKTKGTLSFGLAQAEVMYSATNAGEEELPSLSRGLAGSLFDTMDLQVGHVQRYTNLEDSMLLSCSQAADTSNCI